MIDTTLAVTSVPTSLAERPIKKTIYTLNIGDYAPAIRELTYPLLRYYANKIGAEFVEIKERRFPDWPVTTEKFQVGPLSEARGDDWAIFIDADTLVSPECMDFTEFMRKDTVSHNGRDVANIRWTYDKYLRRDGRHFGSCTWLIIASDWCVGDLFHFPTLPVDEIMRRIHITIVEANSGCCKTEHLIDDYTLSRNIARFGLKATTVTDICKDLGWKDQTGRGVSPHLFHLYAIQEEEKLRRMLDVMTKPQDQGGWALMSAEQAEEFRKKWGVK